MLSPVACLWQAGMSRAEPRGAVKNPPLPTKDSLEEVLGTRPTFKLSGPEGVSVCPAYRRQGRQAWHSLTRDTRL